MTALHKPCQVFLPLFVLLFLCVTSSPVQSDETFAPDQSTLPVAAPKDAVVLYDGEGVNRFLCMEGGEINWPIEDGTLVSTRGKARTNHLVSTLHFRDADIHVEFMLPESEPGNSGIYIHGNYELQIYNSLGKEKLDQGDMGAIYGFADPMVNATREPGEWQVYDIRYRAPRRNEKGEIVEEGTITAWLNGQLVQENTRFGEPRSKYHPYRHGVTPYLEAIWERQKKTGVGPVFLQDHDNPVRFRNVWVRPLDGDAFFYEPKEDLKPNIVFILADDCTYNVLGCYGGKDCPTPNIDRLADEGLLFKRAYCAEAMCAPFRAELYTGLYPVRNGVAWNHSRAKPGTKSVFHHLPELGYRTGIAGKTHASPREVFPYEQVKDFPAGDGVRDFITRDNDQPFCVFLCSHSPHAPWTEGDASQFDQDALTLAPVQHDNPPTRDALARYLAEVNDLDREVGEILALLEKTGHADDTLVFFSSEQGWPLGFAKWSNWNLGVHTALIARWPGHIEPGTTTDALVQMADIVPTLLDLAGADFEDYDLDGSSFLPVLKGQSATHRKYVYGVHNNVPEGNPYPIRSIRDDKYHYLMNLSPETPYHEKHVMVEDSRLVWWPTIQEAIRQGDSHAEMLADKYQHRPAEELYLVDEDPHEMTNVADESDLADVKQRLRSELQRWMDDQDDPGAAIDTPERHSANRRGE